LRGRIGQKHVAGIGRLRQALDTSHRQLRAPTPIEHELGQILSDRGGTGRERKLGVNSAPERRSSTAGLSHAFGWDLGVEFGWAYRSRTLVLEARQQEAQHPKARRNDARGVSRMDPFLE